MAKRSTPTDRIVIDPAFSIPIGAEDQFVYSDEFVDIDAGSSDDDSAVDSLELDVFDEIDYESSYDDDLYEEEALEIPEDFVILSQTLRRGPGGQQVIDIVVETEDVEGAVNYEIQVTKL